MSNFASRETKKIDLPNEEWAKIKVELTFGEVQQIQAAYSDQKQLKLLSIAITEWNLKDGDGKEVPLNEDNINLLKISIVTKLADEILAVYNKALEEDGDVKKNSKKSQN